MIRRQLLAQTVLLGFALIFLQGVIYLLQILASQKLDAPAFNFVRISESLAAVLSLFLSFGLPSVALIWGTKTGSMSGRRRFLVFSGAFILSLVVLAYLAEATGLAAAVVPTEVTSGSSWVPPHFIGIASLVSVRLVLSAMLQSRQRYVALACGTATAGTAALLVGSVVFVSTKDGVMAWLVARYTLEAVACTIFLTIELSKNAVGQSSEPFAARQLFGAALPVGGGIALRALIEHGPLLILAMAGVSAVVLAEVGTAVTVITVSIILVGIVQGVLVPMLAVSMTEKSLRVAALLSAGAVIGSVVVTVVLCALLERTSPHAPFANLIVVLIVVGVVVSKSVASLSGGLLLAMGRMRQILTLNIMVFVALVGVFAFSDQKTSAPQGLVLLLLVEMFGAGIYAAAILVTYFRRRASH